ncbi:hypothetical protein C8F04DRAFT_1173015 [Mycena alexandri]|uniref:Uncharacterized protein n=1 Tax=Mycena alexandri TaxID=1745969 RepID=A0AAD6TIQ5_9AGAR|nr:hypothetical protein C8F04DRAFT_1173015 [Mycena alexandri]
MTPPAAPGAAPRTPPAAPCDAPCRPSAAPTMSPPQMSIPTVNYSRWEAAAPSAALAAAPLPPPGGKGRQWRQFPFAHFTGSKKNCNLQTFNALPLLCVKLRQSGMALVVQDDAECQQSGWIVEEEEWEQELSTQATKAGCELDYSNKISFRPAASIPCSEIKEWARASLLKRLAARD